MNKKFLYPVIITILYIIFVVDGDRVFFISPEEEIPQATEKKEIFISPYIKISAFDNYFREAADSIGWDWKLLAAIGYTESKFDSMARSDMGASGVMQVMPRTFERFGIPDSLHFEPRHNIMTATKLLKNLNYIFRKIDNIEERCNFVLASYNAGIGHISDAMRLAEKHGRNRYKWNNNVDTFLILKKEPEYYTDSLCKNGQFKDWKQTMQFIRKVNRTWLEYRRRQKEYDDSIRHIMMNDSTIKLKTN